MKKSNSVTLAISAITLTKNVCSVASALTLLLCGAPAAMAQAPTLTGPFNWVDSGPLVSPNVDETRKVVSIKDPSAVFYNGRWHVYATYAREVSAQDGRWGMVYFNFTDWKDAGQAKQVFLDEYPQFKGYHCAPEIFYFAPQKLWYLIYQSQDPTYSTTTDPSKPESWTAPKPFFGGGMHMPIAKITSGIDYWMICDDTHAYLFFSDDNGHFYRSRTTLAQFPNGFSDPVIAMQEAEPRDLFEASSTYRIKGTSQYLTLVECASEGWQNRYFKGFIADSLDGQWRPLAAEWGNSFADVTRVRSSDGAPLWTRDISHGELLRDGYDQTMTLDPANLTLLYQGVRPGWDPKLTYVQLPYQLGLLHRETVVGQKAN